MAFIPILLRALPYILAAILAGVVVYRANHWCNTVCKDARVERDQLVAEKMAAQERATALALLWAKSLDDAERKERERESEAARRYDSLLARAQAVDRGPGMRLSVGTIRLLDDASAAANLARPPAVDQDPAESVPPASDTTDEREIAVAWVKASEAYADAFGKWQSCVNFYQSLRSADESQ